MSAHELKAFITRVEKIALGEYERGYRAALAEMRNPELHEALGRWLRDTYNRALTVEQLQQRAERVLMQAAIELEANL